MRGPAWQVDYTAGEATRQEHTGVWHWTWGFSLKKMESCVSRGGVDVKGLGEWVNMIKIDYKTLKELIKLPKKWYIYASFYFSVFTKFQQQWITDRKGGKEPKMWKNIGVFQFAKNWYLTNNIRRYELEI